MTGADCRPEEAWHLAIPTRTNSTTEVNKTRMEKQQRARVVDDEQLLAVCLRGVARFVRLRSEPSRICANRCEHGLWANPFFDA